MAKEVEKEIEVRDVEKGRVNANDGYALSQICVCVHAPAGSAVL